MKYSEVIKEISKKSKNDYEEEINTFFLDLKLDFIDCNATIIKKESKKDIGEIDGIFKYEDQFLFLLEIDKSSDVDTKKQSAFFSKWSNKDNLKLIMDKYKLLTNLKPTKVYMCGNQKRSDKPSIQHQLNDPTNIILYKEDIDYFLKSYKTIGHWTRNDLFSFVGLKNQKTSEEVDAIRLNIDGKRAYLCAMNAYKLLNSCYISRRLDGQDEGYQRLIRSNKIVQISKGIKNSKILAFPNAIILNTTRTLESNYEQKLGVCRINFPTNLCSNKIIDGQHRLLGFSKVDEKNQKEHTLPIIIFEDLNKESEVKTFIDINNTQNKIDPNLLLILKADFSWELDSKFYDEAKIVTLIKDLSERNSFLKNKVFFGYNEPRSDKMTLTTLVGAIKKNNLVGGKLHLLQDEKNKVQPSAELNVLFNAIKSEFKDHANIKKKGFFVSNKGIRIIFRLIQFFIRNKIKKNIDKKLSYNDFLKDVHSLINEKYIKNLEDYYGEGGANKACDKIIKDIKIHNKKKYGKFANDLRKM